MPRATDERDKSGWYQGWHLGQGRVQNAAHLQEHTLVDQFVRTEEGLEQLALVAWQRESRQYKSYQGEAFKRRFIAGWVQGYIRGMVQWGKAPLHRRCRACQYEGEDVHPYAENEEQRQRLHTYGQYECDDLARCLYRVAQQREERVRLYGEHVYGR